MSAPPPTFGSLFAGVGGFDLGFEAAGWTPKWQVEWDARCQSVLARHWPEVTRYGDVCDVGVIPLAGRPDDGHDGRGPQPNVDGRESPRHLLEPVDCVTYGFPCQDLSVAGRRAGLDGDRSNLFFEAVRIIKEMRDATDGRYPKFAVAENVPGLLSADRGVAMGRCLDALADIGAVGIEWAVLDAQHFGVPQRRRRVFIVAWFDPRIGSGSPLLPVGESCSGHSAASATARTTAPGDPGGGAAEDGGAGRGDASRAVGVDEVAQTLSSGSNSDGFRTEPSDHLVVDCFSQSRFADYRPGIVTLRASGGDAHGGSETLVAVKAKRAQSSEDDETWRLDGPAPTLNAFDNGTESRATVLAMQVDGSTVASTLRGFGHGWQGQHNSTNSVATQMGVRRLTPRECERLMGWPDDHTRWAADGREIADTNRYKMCGNGVVAPVSEWVAGRLAVALGLSRQ